MGSIFAEHSLREFTEGHMQFMKRNIGSFFSRTTAIDTLNSRVQLKYYSQVNHGKALQPTPKDMRYSVEGQKHIISTDWNRF